MKELQFSVVIHAPTQHVWDTMWQDENFRQWAGLIDPGTHMVGELLEGNEVQFISGNGYGVTSLVDSVKNGEYLLLKHSADTQDAGIQERDKQWTGGKEEYTLTEKGDTTILTIVFDSPVELEAIMNDSYPTAMARIKELSERTN